MFTIMVVEDNEQLQNEIGNLLISNGYSISKPKDFSKIPQNSKLKLIVIIISTH